MKKDVKKWASIPGTLISGTGMPVNIPSIIPNDKREKEVFWVKELICRLPTFSNSKFQINSNLDDSLGNHDVLIEIEKEENIGVQVTELTSELQKKRSNLSTHHLNKIIDELRQANISAQEKIAIGIIFSRIDFKNPKLP